MMLAWILLGYAAVVALLGGAVLRRSRWVTHYPRLGVWSWLVAFVSVFLAIAMAGLQMISDEVVHLILTGTGGSAAHFAAISAQTACVIVLTIAVAGTFVGATAVAKSARTMRRESARHLAQLRVAARFDSDLNTFVVASDDLAAYSIAGSTPSVVVTEGVVNTLSERELAAVVAHEAEHLRDRHALKLATASGLRRVFGYVPLFRTGHQELGQLLEMVADDSAARTSGRRNVASAVLRMAEARSPDFAMSASAGNVSARVRRLLHPEPRLGRLRTVMGVAFLAAVVSLPALGMVASATATGPALTCASVNAHAH